MIDGGAIEIHIGIDLFPLYLPETPLRRRLNRPCQFAPARISCSVSHTSAHLPEDSCPGVFGVVNRMPHAHHFPSLLKLIGNPGFHTAHFSNFQKHPHHFTIRSSME